MKFGLLYNTDYYPEVHRSPAHYYGDILEETQFAEELGYHAVWFGEHHYSGYSFGAPPVIAMAAAARTKRIKVGAHPAQPSAAARRGICDARRAQRGPVGIRHRARLS